MKLIILFMLTFITLPAKELILRNGNLVEEFALDGLICLDSNDCYAVFIGEVDLNLYNSIYHSKNQGRKWEEKLTIDVRKETWGIRAYNIQSFTAIDSNHFYIGSFGYSIFKYTNDGGKTMNYLQLTEYNNAVWHTVMFDTLKGFVYNTGTFFRTFDGWKTYDSLKKNHTGTYFSKQILNDSIVRWIYANNIDSSFGLKGASYIIDYNVNTHKDSIIYGFEKEYKIDDLEHTLDDIFFVNDTLGFICGYRRFNNIGWAGNDLIYKTTDGGQSWREVLFEVNGSPFGLTKIAFANESYGITVGSRGKIYETQDGGETWTYYPAEDDLIASVIYLSFAGTTAIIGEHRGGIWTWEEPTSVNKELETKENIKVIQTIEELKISIKDPSYLKYRIEIINILGIKQIDRPINSGTGNVYYPIDIKQLNKGTYFYALSLNGATIYTGKFIR